MHTTLKLLGAASVASLLTLSAAQTARAHCQVPCGIYGDHARVEMMREDLATVEKAMRQIAKLSRKRDPLSQNQLARWVSNKEKHAERIMSTIAAYFMAQKIKPKAGDKGYLSKLAKHHSVMVAAMKCKQTVDLKAAAALKRAIDGIAGYWKK